MKSLDIELTDEWVELLFNECLRSQYAIESTTVSAAKMNYLVSRQGWWSRISAVQNYFVTLARPNIATSQQQTKDLLAQQLNTPWHIAQWGPVDLSDTYTTHLTDYLKQKKLPFFSEPAFVNWQLHTRQYSSFNDYMTSRPGKLKSTLKRRKKKLTNDFQTWKCHLISDIAQLEAYFPYYKDIYLQSWKPHEEHIGFIQKFCKIASTKGWLRFGLLEVDNRPIAAQIWFVYNGTAKIFKLAYRPNYKQYSPGTILTEFLMQHVLEQDQVECVDFGMGDEPYKADWMNYKNTRYTVTAFNTDSFAGKLAQLRFQYLPALKKRFRNNE